MRTLLLLMCVQLFVYWFDVLVLVHGKIRLYMLVLVHGEVCVCFVCHCFDNFVALAAALGMYRMLNACQHDPARHWGPRVK
mmetsp:Transcript_10011/g.25907  ORF Transcript_10011/g.25907 Transcript_10011/m.25907 type:complete len:81 (-) Transcript_10011:827-1069(-)